MSSPSAGYLMTSPRVSSATRRPRTSASLTPGSVGTRNASRISTFSRVGPVLTPAPSRTPRGSQGLVLLSPSRTLTESLSALASSTAQQLEEVWDEVGYTPQDRATQLSQLLIQLRDQCQAKIAEESGVAETFRQTIAEAREEIRATAGALKAPVDEALMREDSHRTLTDELADLEAALEILREDAVEARRDLAESREFLMESHSALGTHMEECWHDIETDLTATRREKFREMVDEMKEEVATRSNAVMQLLQDCRNLMEALGIDGHTGNDMDRKVAGSLVRSKDGSFILASKFETDTCVGISATALQNLTTHVADLGREKRRRKNRLQEMGAEIATLWEQLRISEEEQVAFKESVAGLGMDTLEKGEQELQRLKSLKSQMLISLVEDARDTIRALWEQMDATQELCDGFEGMNAVDESDFNDELLDMHEAYIQELEERVEQMKPILRLIERREDIIRERFIYDELQKDSDRLKQRGAAMAKQLMEEEKMAKRIKKELPKLTAFLEKNLSKWVETHGEPFLYQGEAYDETMQNQEDEWKEYKTAAVQQKLKKKQGNDENGGGNAAGSKRGMRPLGSSKEANARSSSRTRPRNGSMPAKPIHSNLHGKSSSSSRYSNHV